MVEVVVVIVQKVLMVVPGLMLAKYVRLGRPAVRPQRHSSGRGQILVVAVVARPELLAALLARTPVRPRLHFYSLQNKSQGQHGITQWVAIKHILTPLASVMAVPPFSTPQVVVPNLQ